MDVDRLDVLAQTFPGLSFAELGDLSAASALRNYPAGSYICREGEQGSVFYILASGEVQVSSQPEGSGKEVILHRSRPPYSFGEVALFGDGRRSATIEALTECVTLEIDKESFHHLANSNPGLREALFRQLSFYMRDTDRLVIQQLNRQNAELQAAYAHLAEQDRMRTEFISTLAHELRTPLTAIQGFMHLIDKGVVTGKALEDGLGTIGRNVDKMVWLVNSLLVLYEMQLIAPRLVPLRPEELVNAAVVENSPAAQVRNVLVQTSYEPNLPSLQVDHAGLTLALRLLLDNAVKFSEAGRPVTIHVSCPDKETISLAVSDQGPGIPQEVQGRIFEPFFRWNQENSTNLYSGLGIGLSIAQSIVSRHQGRIEVESEPGKGSTFRILLPLSPKL